MSLPDESRLALATHVRATLTPQFIRDAMAPHLTKYRARILTVEVVTLCMLELLLRGLPSLGALVRRLRLGELVSVAALGVADSALYQRLVALPHAAFLALLRQATRALPAAPPRADVVALAPFATGVFALDDTTLDAVARKADLVHRVGVGAQAGLGGRLGCAVDVTTGRFRAVAYDSDPISNERHRLLPLVEALPAGALVVVDRGYFAFDLFDALSARFVYFVTRWKEGVTYRVAHTYVETPTYRDQLVWLGGETSKDAMAWPVRRIEVSVRGAAPWAFVTNVWDPQMLRAEHVVRLYAQRWQIERVFATLKQALGMEVLHVSGLNGLLIQVWCTLLLYQTLDHLRAEVGRVLTVPHDEISWPLLVEAIAMYAERPRAEPLRAWLLPRARDLALHVRQPERRLRWRLTPALRAVLQTPPTPLHLATIQPQPPKRRPSRARPKADAYRFLAIIQREEACNLRN